MEIYQDRFEKDYRDIIINQFRNIKDLKNSALSINEEMIDGQKVDKLISIDFIGVSCSILFDKGGNYNPLNKDSSRAFYEFLGKIDDLILEGYKVRIRLLFIYPYSDYALTRIKTERDTNRSSTHPKQREFFRGFDLVNELKEATFLGSTFYQNQMDSLLQVQNLLKENILSSKYSSKSIRVRFTPIGTSICLLKINDTFFFDPYLFAKNEKDEKKLTVGFPLCMINKKMNLSEFLSLEDHFRYLWDLDTTMFCEDATSFNPKNNHGLNDIKKPFQITFVSKEERIKQSLDKKKIQHPSDEQLNQWRFKLQRTLSLATQNIVHIPERESIFITCSWRDDNDGSSNPNEFAVQLENWLSEDFCKNEMEKCLDINLVKAKAGDSLSTSIYEQLNSSSLACIIMAKDYVNRKEGYCNPNIYHELGYLMKQLEGTSRIGILLEEGVKTPSNISDKVYIDKFDKKSFKNSYYKVLEWFKENNSHIPMEYLSQAEKNHALRISRNKRL